MTDTQSESFGVKVSTFLPWEKSPPALRGDTLLLFMLKGLRIWREQKLWRNKRKKKGQ
jgi:hypothetical protein